MLDDPFSVGSINISLFVSDLKSWIYYGDGYGLVWFGLIWYGLVRSDPAWSRCISLVWWNICSFLTTLSLWQTNGEHPTEWCSRPTRRQSFAKTFPEASMRRNKSCQQSPTPSPSIKLNMSNSTALVFSHEFKDWHLHYGEGRHRRTSGDVASDETLHWNQVYRE